jgi:hypothetical protein
MASGKMLGRVSSGTGVAEELSGAWVLLQTVTVDDDANIVFTIPSGYAEFEWVFNNVLALDVGTEPVSQNVRARVSNDGGATYFGDDEYDYLRCILFINIPGLDKIDTGIGVNGFGRESELDNYIRIGYGTLDDFDPAINTYVKAKLKYIVPIASRNAVFFVESTGSYNPEIQNQYETGSTEIVGSSSAALNRLKIFARGDGVLVSGEIRMYGRFA